jgi:hypothetical protein
MQNQQPRLIAFRRGLLCNQLRRQDKIEISGSHRASFGFRAGSFKPTHGKVLRQFHMIFKL